MRTNKQRLGDYGENLIAKNFSCPKCKRSKTLKRLPHNFKCADIICDFCGYLAQVKTSSVKDVDKFPNQIRSAAWEPQKERMNAGIYFPLFVVLIQGRKRSVFYLPSDLQTEAMFRKRNPLKPKAKRSGWIGYNFDGKRMEKFVSKLL